MKQNAGDLCKTRQARNRFFGWNCDFDPHAAGTSIFPHGEPPWMTQEEKQRPCQRIPR
jgi:hypothetical protein